MTGIIDVGGGIRGIYGAGVFDYCLDENIVFDVCIGVSAGSANIASFLAKQKGRNYLFYHNYAFRKEYMSFSNLIKTGEYIGLDYIYSVLTNSDGENPLDYDTMKNYDGIVNFSATDTATGEVGYFDINDMKKDDYKVLNASCAIPCVCRSVEINGKSYYDGGIANPVPVDRAFELGCDKVVIILTKPLTFVKDMKLEKSASFLLKRKYPEISRSLMRTAEKYNNTVKELTQGKYGGKCLVIAPDDCAGVDTLKFTREGIDTLYKKGFCDAVKIKEFLNNDL